MPDAFSLIHLLADGRFRSGEELGRYFGVSRAAIWKALQRLSEYGLELQSVRGKGYRLSRPIEVLECPEILRRLPQEDSGGIEVYPVLDSTNTRLMQNAATLHSGHACLAEGQTAGRGRRGRTWVSPFGANIYLSMFWRFDGGAERLGGLSLALAVGIVRALEGLGGQEIGIKWPNDLLYSGRKLAGILVEVAGEADGACHVVAGLGLNINMPRSCGGLIEQPWADAREAGISAGRNEIAAVLVNGLRMAFRSFEREGLSASLDEWRKRDILAGSSVRLHFGDQHRDGIALGVDSSGFLLVERQGKVERYASGEVSVRKTGQPICC